jgi:hypothetical protein
MEKARGARVLMPQYACKAVCLDRHEQSGGTVRRQREPQARYEPTQKGKPTTSLSWREPRPRTRRTPNAASKNGKRNSACSRHQSESVGRQESRQHVDALLTKPHRQSATGRKSLTSTDKPAPFLCLSTCRVSCLGHRVARRRWGIENTAWRSWSLGLSRNWLPVRLTRRRCEEIRSHERGARFFDAHWSPLACWRSGAANM